MEDISTAIPIVPTVPIGYTFKVVQDLVDVADKESILLRSGEDKQASKHPIVMMMMIVMMISTMRAYGNDL